MKLRKLITMGLATIMAISAMSMSAMAKEAVYDDETGELVGYQYTEDEINWDKVAQMPMMVSNYSSHTMTASQPTYSSAKDIDAKNMPEEFTLPQINKYRYSRSWYNTGDLLGIYFNDLDVTANYFNFKIYEIDSSGDLTQVKSMTPASYAAAISFSGLDSSARYCLKVTNKYSGEVSGTIEITNDIDSYFN